MFTDSIIRDNVLDIWNSVIKYFPFTGSIEKYTDFLPIFLIGFLITFILTPLIGNLAKKNNVVYIPNSSRKEKDFDNPEKAMHEGIIPALGGAAVLLPILLAMLFIFKFNSVTLPFFISISILIIGGVLDDIFNFPAKIQLAFQILAAFIIAASVLDLGSFSILGLEIPMDLVKYQPVIGNFNFSLTFPGDLILLVWLIFCINSFKWVGGSPGLIEGNAFVVTTLIFIISIRHQVLFSSTISILASGSLLAFLIFAYPPPLIMSGSSGKSTYGLLICTLALISQAKFASTLILLLLPSLDAIFVLVNRYITYKPKNVIELMKINGATHFHHHLLKMNLSRQQVFWIEMVITLSIGSLAIITAGAYRYLLLIVGIILTISIILFVNFKAREKEKNKKKESSEARYSY